MVMPRISHIYFLTVFEWYIKVPNGYAKNISYRIYFKIRKIFRIKRKMIKMYLEIYLHNWWKILLQVFCGEDKTGFGGICRPFMFPSNVLITLLMHGLLNGFACMTVCTTSPLWSSSSPFHFLQWSYYLKILNHCQFQQLQEDSWCTQ